MKEIKKNLTMPPLEVKHKELRRIGDSMFRSECPICNTGVLLFQRDSETLKLKKNDNCVGCGRRFIYIDIIEEFALTYVGV